MKRKRNGWSQLINCSRSWSRYVESMFNANWEELLYPEMHEQFTDPFASHVYQAILYTLNGEATKNLAGVPEEPKSKKRKVQPKAESVFQTPSFFAALREKLLGNAKAW